MYVRPRPRFRPRNAGTGFQPSLALNFLSGSLSPAVTFSRGTQATQYTSNGTLQYAPNNLLTYSNQADNAAWTKSNSFVQTNLLTYSQEFDNAAWTKSNATVTANTVIAPDGTLTADKLVEDATLASHYAAQSVTTVAVAYAYSVYVKAAERSFVLLWSATANFGRVFNLSNGTVSGTVAGVTQATADIANAGNGWYRCTIYGTCTAASNSFRVYTMTDATTFSYTGDGVSGIYVWGGQLVQGSVPGDYVATTSAALPVLYADYQGNLRARKLCENTVLTTHEATQDVVTAAQQYTFSAYIKAGERTFAMLYHGTSNSAQVINLTTGAASGNAGLGAPLAYVIANAGNGWWRLSITVTATAATNNFRIYPLSNSTTYSYAGDGSSGIYIADAQLEAGSTVQAYNDTTSAAYYGPRFDYDPTNYVRQNLLLQSQTFNTGWTLGNLSAFGSGSVADATIAPDGTLTADRLAVSTASAYVSLLQAINVTPSTTYTFSYWLNTTTSLSGNTIRIYNVTGAADIVAGQACVYSGGWVRQTCTFTTPAACTQIYVYPISVTVGAGTVGQYFDLYGAQLNVGSTALTYTATTTAPYTLVAARGLLIEEQRTNLLLQSNDFQTSWTPTNITRTLASTTGPDGTLSGVKIEATTAAGTSLLQAATVAATSATGSVYVKQGTGATIANAFLIRNATTATILLAGTLNYSTGVFTYTTGVSGATATNVGNGWWRLQLSVTSGITSGDSIALYTGWGGIVATAGDFLYAYGAQLEAGAFATSYLPTVGSQVTRAADSASITTLTPWFNAAAGTLVTAYQSAANIGQDIAMFTAGAPLTASLGMYAISNDTTIAGWSRVGGVTQANPTSSVVIAKALHKNAFAYAANDFAISSNGGTVGTTASGSLPTVDRLIFGASGIAGTTMAMWLSSVSFYQTRLPNASLQGLTV